MSAEAIDASIAPSEKITAAVALVLAVFATSSNEATTASWALGWALLCAACSVLAPLGPGVFHADCSAWARPCRAGYWKIPKLVWISRSAIRPSSTVISAITAIATQ